MSTSRDEDLSARITRLRIRDSGRSNPPSPSRPTTSNRQKPLPATPGASPPFPVPVHHVAIPPLPRPPPMLYDSPTPYPVRMPVPHLPASSSTSLTMKHALETPINPPSPSPSFPTGSELARLSPPTPLTRPRSNPNPPPASPAKSLAPPPSSSRRASEPPPSSTKSNKGKSKPTSVLCEGVNKGSGLPCKNRVKVPVAEPVYEDEERQFLNLCHVHRESILEIRAFKAGEETVRFADWVPDYLSSGTRAQLHHDMSKPRSDKDQPGYIYVFEIHDDNKPDIIQLKVGRAHKLNKRLDQWQKQCGSKIQITRGWWPGTVDESGRGGGKATLGVFMHPGEPGPWCHRLEKLIHLELADLVLYQQYLHSEYPLANFETIHGKVENVSDDSLSETGNSQAVQSKGKKKARGSQVQALGKEEHNVNRAALLQLKKEICDDCGTVHQEIFAFRRAEGKYKGREFEAIVEPIIHKWGQYVAKYL
ncbi:hypothetical protein SISNIDRAFT_447819 [Sistotremastrum niveocremeum HHB9708]|uniref:Bacteriophage T5 Orf172 DNA-binding domain-containing protein n=1 Tax=Sistotremastrum niveocremeum HHB9708 TaxID=1314777 RepID=A0A165AH72_9AGAM|nr:hypothetical protein SISNIDRAFT_447819 [Sistotremastrum niveocremeum HHB9708]